MKVSEKQVSILLRKMGIPCSLSGFYYLKQAIMLVASDKSYAHSIMKRLYPDVAKKFNKNARQVERSIRHAIEKTFDNYATCEFNNEVLLSAYSAKKGRPSNSEFILAVVEYLKYQDDEE